jgi:Predicted membrane protein (DUF2254)
VAWFRRDRTLIFALSTFSATFVFALVSTAHTGRGTATFVSSRTLIAALLLTLLSILMFLLLIDRTRAFGAGQYQVARRLRALLDALIADLPEKRRPPLVGQGTLLDDAVASAIPRGQRAAALVPDRQGIGMSHRPPGSQAPGRAALAPHTRSSPNRGEGTEHNVTPHQDLRRPPPGQRPGRSPSRADLSHAPRLTRGCLPGVRGRPREPGRGQTVSLPVELPGGVSGAAGGGVRDGQAGLRPGSTR